MHYKAFNVTDAYQSAINPVSDFVKFDPVTNTLSVWTKDTKIAGTYYLMFDAFLKNYETDPKYPHRKEYMKLILVNPVPLATPLPANVTANVTDPAPPTPATNITTTPTVPGPTGPPKTNITIPMPPVEEPPKAEPTPAETAAALVKNATAEVVKEFTAVLEALGEGSAALAKNLPPLTLVKEEGTRLQLRYSKVRDIEISRDGLVTITPDEPCTMPEGGITPSMLNVMFIKHSDEDVSMTWEVQSFSPNEIKIQLTFNEPLLVSSDDIMDQVEIKVSSNLFLPAENPYEYVPESAPKQVI